jgi:mono/diheme cytochrome c family protein
MTRWLALALSASMVMTHAYAEDDAEARVVSEQACQMCHSVEMISQQRLTRAQWDKTVAKMAKWGPALGPGEDRQIADFLSGPKGPPASPSPAPPPRMTTLAAVEATLAPEGDAEKGDADKGAERFAKICATCHGKDARGDKAPSLVGRPVLSRPADWQAAIDKGRRRMPGFQNVVSAGDATDMLAWVRKISRESVMPPVPK